MNEVLLLHTCDAWHTHDSMRLVGVFTCRSALDRYLHRMAIAGEIAEKVRREVLKHHQTQGYDTNLFLQIQPLNPTYKNEFSL